MFNSADQNAQMDFLNFDFPDEPLCLLSGPSDPLDFTENLILFPEVEI